MNNFIKVCRFEFLNLIKKKSYIFTTLLLSIIIIIMFLVPSVMDFTGDRNRNFKYLVVDNTNLIDKNLFKGNDKYVFSSNGNIDNKYDGIAYIDSDFNIKFIPSSNRSYRKTDLDDLTKIITVYFQKLYIKESNISIPNEEIDKILNLNISYYVTLDKDETIRNFITIILIIAMFLMISCYCQSIARTVIKEKSKRVIEILLTLVNSKSIIFGKVCANILSIIIQLFSLISVTLICIHFFNNDMFIILKNIFNINFLDLIKITFIFLLSFIFYSFIYTMVATFAKTSDDLDGILMPIGIIITIIFFIIISILDTQNTVLLKIISFIPFSMFGAMPIRILMNDVNTFEIIIAIFIMIVSIYLTGSLSSKLYSNCINVNGKYLPRLVKKKMDKYDKD